MNRESAVIKAAFVLGVARNYLRNRGEANLATDCDNAIKDLQASVAESRALDDAVVTGTEIHKLIEALTYLATRYAAIRL